MILVKFIRDLKSVVKISNCKVGAVSSPKRGQVAEHPPVKRGVILLMPVTGEQT